MKPNRDFEIVYDKFFMACWSDMFCGNCKNEPKCNVFTYIDDDNEVEPCETFQEFRDNH